MLCCDKMDRQLRLDEAAALGADRLATLRRTEAQVVRALARDGTHAVARWEAADKGVCVHRCAAMMCARCAVRD